ncbi:C1-like protein [Cynara cardunculus var. scolymus]|uniref:C1-like protein n=1 Tax=Cynara cardunculus var. scolymus TaxID=59895 RepID=A0A103XBM0_CYNCS|nr:C1-like protein [Cynara cardunculus var. scolymus]
MDQGYKHFCHSHNLIMHQMPEGVEVSCSGCNSSGTGIVYVCWQCNFFLHEQCYRATRSLQHPSHPLHPLTLVPYPTYPSNSFYCNSCQSIGTGFSYSCADCEFDLHVQCAFSISRVPSFQTAHQYPTSYYDPDQELAIPGWNGQSINMAHNSPFVSVSYSLSNPPTAAHNPYMAPSAHSVPFPNPITSEQYYSTGQDLAYVSIPPDCQNSITTAQDPSRVQDGPSVSVPTSSQNSIAGAQYFSMAQTGPSVSVPISSQNSITGTQYPSMPPNRPSVSIPISSQNPVAGAQYSSMAQTGPSVTIPISSQNSNTGTQYPSMPQNGPSVSIPTSFQNPVTQIQYPSLVQDVASVPIPTKNENPITTTQNSNMAQKIASISVPAASPNNQLESHVESGQNQVSDKGIMHFSHPHNLFMVNLQDKEDEVACSGCEENLIGKGYSCVEPKCDFHLHESCFHLEKEIRHKSHPEHPLTLLSLTPHNDKNSEFTCNACFSDGTGFTYHCSVCTFDLHVQCVSLPETVERNDHEHVLKLFYSCPKKGEEEFSCDVCHGAVQKDRWAYYCESCDYCTHLGCVDCDECEGDSVLDAQMQLQRLQLQMEMTRQHAQLIASMGASLM